MAAEPGDRVAAVLAGETVELLAARALYRPSVARLYLADLHLGKGDVFRRAGVGLPSGGTVDDLARLGAAVRATGATSVCILGDVVHGAVYDSGWRDTFAQWRDAFPHVHVAALIGNHDRALAGAGLGIELLGEAFDDGPFALRHEPVDVPGLHVLAGHLHPCIPLPGLCLRRWPAFWLRPGLTVLPAFSAFTGGCHVTPERADGLVVCADGTAAWVRRPRAEHGPMRVPRRA